MMYKYVLSLLCLVCICIINREYIVTAYTNFSWMLLYDAILDPITAATSSRIASSSPTPSSSADVTSTSDAESHPQELLLTPQQLALHSASSPGDTLYLGLLGKIYDVSAKPQYYGKDGGYSFFTGVDGSRGFVSGDFTPAGLTDDVADLSHDDYLGLLQWAEFYQSDYKYVGKVIGRYYDSAGVETDYYQQLQSWIAAAHSNKQQKEEHKKLFPPCNSEWTQEDGSTVWCSKKSGGVDRPWVGVPRLYHAPGAATACVCANTELDENINNPQLKLYEGCHPTSARCKVLNIPGVPLT